VKGDRYKNSDGVPNPTIKSTGINLVAREVI
jgi:hypothetical protein